MTNTVCKVSILVPIYGVEKYVERCARSLFEQTCEDIEYIFVDDCSPDRSIKILNDIVEQYPMRKPHVHVIKHESNRGLAAARNTAIECCQTEFLMHVDSDDWIDNDAVEKLLKKQSETGADIVAYDVKMHFLRRIETRIKPLFETPDSLILALLRKQINSGVCGALIRTSLYKANNIKIVDGINMSEDLQVYPRLAYYAKKVATLNGVFYHYYFANQNSYTHNETIFTCRQVWKTYEILEKFFLDKNDRRYLEALKEGKKKSLARQLMSGCLHDTGKEIFVAAHQQLKELTKVNEISLKIQEKIAIRIPTYEILRLYIYLINLVKKVIIIKL